MFIGWVHGSASIAKNKKVKIGQAMLCLEVAIRRCSYVERATARWMPTLILIYIYNIYIYLSPSPCCRAVSLSPLGAVMSIDNMKKTRRAEARSSMSATGGASGSAVQRQRAPRSYAPQRLRCTVRTGPVSLAV